MATFSLHYGRDDSVLDRWQQLCIDCGVGALRSVAINIWDLIKGRESGELPVQRYRNKTELRKDLQNRSRRFPLRALKASGENKLLRTLLVTIA
ncbi:hypothetical protein M409DRAFT_71633 [Zasmidium cellare ATCC 36951]|uniref:Uncharacterized protein n=1 Tax=Zasmidium cellare ATCC 36951 TaxID=1080233 RepID=A0A6A6BUQ1_ZASCE|nr:uncharacterized protein M409DRAFT_71633 [Zasmidium cellare ATCC 36951]KAF2158471.1 hypothetical protein M409DRAFT_71633 [Zasmidium cellare ATCC 36951]